MKAYAHSHPELPSERWHLLEDHLREVGRRAADFAAPFGSSEWARFAGLWHDLGKYRPAFQRMIYSADGENAHVEDEKVAQRVDHSSVGAAYAQQHLGSRADPIALAIAGHHCGLQNLAYWRETRSPNTKHLLKEVDILTVPADIRAIPQLTVPAMLSGQPSGQLTRKMEFWTRVLFSSLVDADRLDTEAFLAREKAGLRGRFPPLGELTDRLRKFMEELAAKSSPSAVNVERGRVLSRCREVATHPPGIFSLTVPTGGGKTYASLTFALEHALANGMERIIVVAPYLTIIDQTVSAYQKALHRPQDGKDALILVEHHSGIDPEKENFRNRLASENWDAPLVVTTAIQFIESLFARNPSQCRKLHNLARSVIVIDEAQTLPGDFLLPIVDVLGGLVEHYGVSLLLSTATQPELRERVAPDGRKIAGFRNVIEIAGTSEEVKASFARLRRVKPERALTKDWDEIAALVAREPRALAITHRRDDARVLAERVQALRAREPLFHLSALMCARHRQERIEVIKLALKSPDAAVRVVSTQLVEAGVDFDFPVVFRAMAGLDSLIQSAGRCNREGSLTEGRLVIFDAPTQPPVGQLRTAADETRALLAADPGLDLFDPDIYRRFDARLQRISDRKGIQAMREKFAFEDVARELRLIDGTWQATVIVPWGPIGKRTESLELLAQVENVSDPRFLREVSRRLQGYSISISRRQADEWLREGILYAVQDLFLALTPPYRHLYTEEFGLITGKDRPSADPAAFIG